MRGGPLNAKRKLIPIAKNFAVEIRVGPSSFQNLAPRFYCIIYNKESNNLMEEQRTRPGVVQPEPCLPDNIASFLLKTYQILENPKYCEIVGWTRDGQGFIVKKVKEFSESVLPVYFRHRNYTSFVRQLNMYDFHKTRQENHQNAFKNLMFRRGAKHLLKDIQRKDYKKNKDNKEAPAEGNQEKAQDLSKGRQGSEISKDFSRNNRILLELNYALEAKSLSLASVTELPTQNEGLLKLLDLLFDAKKIHKEIVGKLQALSVHSKEVVTRKASKKFSIQSSYEKDYPTTSAKVSLFEAGKEERQISTNCFLSFNQI